MSIVKSDGRERTLPASAAKQRTRLFVLRHGQVIGHDEFRFHGFNDVGVTDEGIRQLRQAAEELRSERIDEIYCSDLLRARKGAEAIAHGRDIVPTPLTDLREMNFGDFDGLRVKDIMKTNADLLNEWRSDIMHHRLPGGECMLDLEKRVKKALDKILENGQGKNIAIVAHGGVNRIILTHALSMETAHAFRIEQDYGCLNVIDYYPDWAVVKLINRIF